MDRISLLSDDVIFKILSYVPSKVAVSTDLLSKRWHNLWKHAPKLEYHDPTHDTDHWRASRFVDKFLLLHKAPVLETLHLNLGRNCPSTDVETWMSVAISRGVRDLRISQTRSCSGPIRLPRSLYTCETLVALHLHSHTTVVDVPSLVCLRSLKFFILALVKFSNNEMVHRLLSGCPVLKKLTIIRGQDNVQSFTIAVPSLQRLTVSDSGDHVPRDDVRIVIEAPSVKSLYIFSRCKEICSSMNMPHLAKADVKLRHGNSKKFMGYLTSAKNLSFCLPPPMDSCPIGVFNQLVSLNLCSCSLVWYRLILNHAPKLRVLRFEKKDEKFFRVLGRCCSSSVDVQSQWQQPSSVPTCLISSLETVEWIGYKGTQAEKEVVMYLLENSRQLKTMAITSLISTDDKEKLKMLQELSSTQRSSTKCRLSFT